MPKRNTWFFTRPKRFLDTYKLIQLLISIRGVVKKNKWKGNKEIQKQFTKEMEALGIKKEGNQRDKNSGGARTYYAQLKSLGLFHKNKLPQSMHWSLMFLAS